MSNQSSAYDFALFEPKDNAEPERLPQRKSNVIELPKERLRKNRASRPRLRKLIPSFLAFLLIAGITGTYIDGQLQLSELSNAMGAARKTLQEQQNQYTQMKLKSDSSLSMEVVESYATQKLGMQQTTADQVTTVQLTKGDKSEVVQKSPNGAWAWLEQAWEKVKGFLS
jgi:cell division protein FtsL